jgi:spectinomycin phosphotransferase
MPTVRERLDTYLRACLRDRYARTLVSLESLALGLDTTAQVYRATDDAGGVYFIKARSRALYSASCLAPRYLADQGVTAIVAPLPTTDGALWARLTPPEGAWVIALYPYITGVSGWRPGMTDAQWHATGEIVRRIHDTGLPTEVITSLRGETFDVSDYARAVQTFAARFAAVLDVGDTAAERALREQWQTRRATIHTLVDAMRTLAERLRGHAGPYVLCHGDLHPGNLLRDGAAGAHVVDWDDVLLAPKERDFLFVGEPAGDGSGQADTPFFQGYQPKEIDWVAVTYYRCERVVQDVIECAHEVCFRDDLEAGAKADAARLFGDLFTPDGNMDAARRASTRLPPDLEYLTARLLE